MINIEKIIETAIKEKIKSMGLHEIILSLNNEAIKSIEIKIMKQPAESGSDIHFRNDNLQCTTF